jgi:hypothetical protein
MKISKATWMILGAGIFIIVLSGLGVARYGQVQERDSVSENLSVSTIRLNKLQVITPQAQIDELQEEVNDVQRQTGDIKARLIQSIISVDVADKFYEIAGFYSVNVTSLGTSALSEQPFADIPCEIISLTASVAGTMDKVIAFVKGINDNYTTGFIRSAQLDLKDPVDSTANIQMIVYSYRGKKDGQ